MSDFPITANDSSTINDAAIARSVLKISNVNKRTININTIKMRSRNFTIVFKL